MRRSTRERELELDVDMAVITLRRAALKLFDLEDDSGYWAGISGIAYAVPRIRKTLEAIRHELETEADRIANHLHDKGTDDD